MELVKKKKRTPGTLGKYFYVFVLPALAIYLIFSIVPFYTQYFIVLLIIQI